MVASLRNISARSVRVGQGPIPNPYTCNDSPLTNDYAVYFEGFTGIANDPLLGIMGNKVLSINEWVGAQNDYVLSGDCLLLFNEYVNQPINWMYLDNQVGVDANVIEFTFRVRVGTNSRFWMELQGGDSSIQFDVSSDLDDGNDRIQIGAGAPSYVPFFDTLTEPNGTFVDNDFHTYKILVSNTNTIQLWIDDQLWHAPVETLPDNFIPFYGTLGGYGPYVAFRLESQYDNSYPQQEVFALDYIGIAGAAV
jgi:hypothetical protein